MNSPFDNSNFFVGIFLFYGFIILLGLASFVFWIVELIDVCRREFRDSNTKTLWVLVVVLAHGLGALIYFFAGKPQGWLPGESPVAPPNYGPYSPPPGQWPPTPGQSYPNPPYSSNPQENKQE